MHRANTPKGPMRDREIRGNQKVAAFPNRMKKSWEFPLKSNIARIPKKGTKTPVSKMPNVANPKWPWLICPTRRGKTRFPEPKNIENMARPVDRISALFFIGTSFSVFFYIS